MSSTQKIIAADESSGEKHINLMKSIENMFELMKINNEEQGPSTLQAKKPSEDNTSICKSTTTESAALGNVSSCAIQDISNIANQAFKMSTSSVNFNFFYLSAGAIQIKPDTHEKSKSSDSNRINMSASKSSLETAEGASKDKRVGDGEDTSEGAMSSVGKSGSETAMESTDVDSASAFITTENKNGKRPYSPDDDKRDRRSCRYDDSYCKRPNNKDDGIADVFQYSAQQFHNFFQVDVLHRMDYPPNPYNFAPMTEPPMSPAPYQSGRPFQSPYDLSRYRQTRGHSIYFDGRKHRQHSPQSRFDADKDEQECIASAFF